MAMLKVTSSGVVAQLTPNEWKKGYVDSWYRNHPVLFNNDSCDEIFGWVYRWFVYQCFYVLQQEQDDWTLVLWRWRLYKKGAKIMSELRDRACWTRFKDVRFSDSLRGLRQYIPSKILFALIGSIIPPIVSMQFTITLYLLNHQEALSIPIAIALSKNNILVKYFKKCKECFCNFYRLEKLSRVSVTANRKQNMI